METINKEAPREWRGISGTHRRPVAVEGVSDFFKRETESDYDLPPADWEFGEIVESHLFFIKNGRLFHDPLGEFSSKRAAFCAWPPDLLKKRIGVSCWRMWHYGRYNFTTRVVRRDDSLAATTCLGQFLDATMRLCIYIDGDFAPYWKWISFWFRRLPWTGDLVAKCEGLAQSTSKAEQGEMVSGICHLLETILKERGLEYRIEA
jgi:hypothetical protein